MAREVTRGFAYALHLLLGVLAAALPLLGWLQNAGLVSHGFAQAWGMMIVLSVGLPALGVVPVAVVLSVLPRPPDPALLSLAGLVVATALSLLASEDVSDVFVGLYLLASLALGIRWLAGLWKLRRTKP